jgi:hypothetical protein
MKENEQAKYNILRKISGLGPITNSEWEFMVEKSKTLRHIGANIVGASIVEENILDLLCRIQTKDDEILALEQKVKDLGGEVEWEKEMKGEKDGQRENP